MYKIMTPGPTQVAQNVREARSVPTTNSDLDASFYKEYQELCKDISELLHTKNETFILSGEGILGLEAACASLTEPGDKVLVLDNGVYGKGFADFVSMYGGIPELYTVDDRREIDVNDLENYLKLHHDYKYATLVHCDTPSGMLNDIHAICPLLKSYGIMTVVDSVSGMIGNEVNIDQGKIDILCGGSQKAISAPIGLTLVTISQQAKETMLHRKTKITSYYCNLVNFFDYMERQWFPYTMPISDIYGLRQAIWNIKEDKNILKRHEVIANATRQALIKGGLKLHLQSGFSNTVTVFDVPDGLSCVQILNRLRDEYDLMLAGSFDVLEGKVIRIGHMGSNCNKDDMTYVLECLEKVFVEMDFEVKTSFVKTFLHHFED